MTSRRQKNVLITFETTPPKAVKQYVRTMAETCPKYVLLRDQIAAHWKPSNRQKKTRTTSRQRFIQEALFATKDVEKIVSLP